ncbi:MAG: DUF952 domain-containing protein [Streptosporangiales bacterium]
MAAAADWERARRDGAYRVSTRGRTLDQEGFIHASTAAQVAPVANAFYADHDGPLLLLTLDPGRIGADIRWEPVPGHADPFPHIYGPIPVAAVIRAVPLEPGPAGQFTF